MKFRAVSVYETVIQHSSIAASIGGRVSRVKNSLKHRVSCRIGQSSFISEKEYSSRESAEKAAKRMSKKFEED